MVKQYPHTIKLVETTTAERDEDGDWTSGDALVFVLSGRFEPSKSNAMIKLQDGTQVLLSGIVYMPLNTASVLPVGATIIVEDNNGNVLLSDTIKQHSRGQLNQRLWV